MVEEAAKNNYLNTKIAKNPKLGYPSLEALNNLLEYGQRISFDGNNIIALERIISYE